jgi:hypothetical protein
MDNGPVKDQDSAPHEPARAKRRKRRRMGTLNVLSEPLPVVEGTEWGPAMKELPSDRHRAFVLALYQVPPGYGAHVKAAKLAGFGSSTSSAKSWSVIATRLAHDERILEALREEDQKRIRASAPRAIRALQNIIEDPDHRDHARGIGMVLDRVHPVETTHHVKVEHRRTVVVATEEVLARIAALAAQAGLDPRLLPPTIDGICEEISPYLEPADHEHDDE